MAFDPAFTDIDEALMAAAGIEVWGLLDRQSALCKGRCSQSRMLWG